MGRKTKTDPAPTAGLTDEHRTTLQTLYDAIGAALGTSAAPADTPADDGLGGSDDGLGGSDDGLGGDDGLGEEAKTIEDVREALKAVIKKNGNDAGKKKVAAILKKFGAATLPDLAEDKFADAIALAEKHS